MSIEQINAIDLVDFLTSLGYQPEFIRGNNYWYVSMLPDRFEKTPSFVVNRKRNRWKDFGNGAGTTVVSFCMFYFKWTIREMVEYFSNPSTSVLPSVTRNPLAQAHQDDRKIEIVRTHPLQTFYLQRYLWERRIAPDVSQKHCVEAHYRIGDREYYAIGFRCDAGGYELRNKFFKGSSAPKSPTFIDNGSDAVVLLEGFFELLTFETFFHFPGNSLPNFHILNSTSFFEQSITLLKRHSIVYGFLNNDPTGDYCTARATEEIPQYKDCRMLFKGYKDLNNWVCSIGNAVIPALKNSGFNGISGP